MAQKIQFCLVSSIWDEKAEAFVDTYHKDKLYDPDNKASRKELALAALQLLYKGFKLKLITYVDRDSITIGAKDLF